MCLHFLLFLRGGEGGGEGDGEDENGGEGEGDGDGECASAVLRMCGGGHTISLDTSGTKSLILS